MRLSDVWAHCSIHSITELLANLSILDVKPPVKLYTHQAAEENACCLQELKCIVQGTEAKAYVDKFNVHLEFGAAWMKLYNTFLGPGAKDRLAAQFEKTIQIWYNRPEHGFPFNTYVECHKTTYQSILALAKRTNYTAYDPCTHVCHFLNGIMDPALAQAKLSLDVNCELYSDATVEYLINQVSHHQVNQQLNIAGVGSGTPGCLKTCNGCSRELEMPVIEYSCEEWAQLLSAQTTSIQKHHVDANGDSRSGCGGRLGGGDHKWQHKSRSQWPRNPKSDKFQALTASVTTLSKNLNVMAAHVGGQSSDDDDGKPAADGKMGANMRNTVHTKTSKKEGMTPDSVCWECHTWE